MSVSYLSFSIAHRAPEETNPTALVSEIRRFLENELGQNDRNLNVESDAVESDEYFSIDSERRYLEETWRLVIRAYAADANACVEVLTEVIGADGESRDTRYPGARGVIPRFVPKLVERYICTSGPHRIGVPPEPESLSQFKELLFGKDRKLPVLLVSCDSDSGFPFGDPEDLTERLFGRVLVVCAPHDNRLRDLGYQFNVRGGSARIIWPGASQNNVGGRSGYFHAGTRVNAQQFAAQVIKAIDDNPDVPVEDTRREFESGYMKSRMHCLEGRNAEYLRQSRHAERQDSSADDRELARERRRARKAEEKLERAVEIADKTERDLSETQARLETARRDIDRLEEESDTALGKGAAESERKSRGTIDKLEKELKRARDESTQLRSLAEPGPMSVDDDKRLTLSPTDKNPQQLTVLNHAFNLMRDPSRDYIMGRLSRQHEKDEIESRLSRSVRLDTDSARRKLKADPKSFMDITNFEYIVSAERECFGGDTDLPRRLREIREQRNRVVHPDYRTSANRGMAIKTLNNISETLKIMGATAESNEVRKLRAAL